MPVRPLVVHPGEGVHAAVPALRAMLDGNGPLLLPHRPHEEPVVHDHDSGLGAGIAVGTSGSTGRPKRALLSAAALRASAAATHEALGGPGRWVLALPPHHIAGLQVVLRSLVAGEDPVAVPAGRSGAADLAAAAGRVGRARAYTSLVPTQLGRLLAEPGGPAALRAFDAVLLGGAATPPALLERAREARIRIVTTYGMSETAGGCVYDGRPLPGARVRVEQGRILLAGPMLASGYLGDPDAGRSAFVELDGRRWLRTDDGGVLDADGRLRVTGRLDDHVSTGGLLVAPAVVEAALEEVLPRGAQALVVGVPDQEWGEVVGALLAPAAGADPADLSGRLGDLLPALRERLPAHALPRRVAVVGALPTRGPGKPDRSAARLMLRDAVAVGHWGVRRVEGG